MWCFLPCVVACRYGQQGFSKCTLLVSGVYAASNQLFARL